MTKISVIIPIFNTEMFVQQCLKSVVEQTYKDIEIICVNDCTKDSSIKIIEEFQDDRIKIIHHKENLGLAKARNTGLSNANGEYVFFLDSDDFIEETILEKLLNEIEKTNVDMVFSRVNVFPDEKENNKTAKILERYFNSKKMLKNIEINEKNFKNALSYFPVVAWGKLYRTSFLKENNIRFIDKNIVHEDDGFYVKIMSRYPKIACIEDVGVNYRIRKNSIVSKINKNKNEEDLKASLEDSFDFIKDERIIKKVKYSKIYFRYFNKFFKACCKLKEVFRCF